MRVLIISSTVSSLISVGKIATELNSYLKDTGNSVLLLHLDTKESAEYASLQSVLEYKVYYQLAWRTRYCIRVQPFLFNRLKKQIASFQPDIIHLIQPSMRFVDNNRLFKLIGETQIPCVYSMIDENAYLGDCDNAFDCKEFENGCINCHGENYQINYEDYKGQWRKESCRTIARQKQKAYSHIKRICFIAPKWVIQRAEKSFLLRGKKLYAVDEFIDNKNIFVPRKGSFEKWKALGLNLDKKIILNVARYSNTRKGVSFFITLAEEMEANSEYQFVNVGYDGKNIKLPSNFIGIPFVQDQIELSILYSLADLFVITSLSDTMPNSCLEALSCGTPVCGFNITGIPYVADEPLGVFVTPTNIKELKSVVINTKKKSKDISNSCREYALKRYSPEVCCRKILSIYHEMLMN